MAHGNDQTTLLTVTSKQDEQQIVKQEFLIQETNIQRIYRVTRRATWTDVNNNGF